MPVNPYAVLLALDDDECRQLALLTEEDELFDSAVCASLHFWRDHLRPRYGDPVRCRQAFLLHGKLRLLHRMLPPTFGPKVLAALLLTLADRVEVGVCDYSGSRDGE